MATWCTAAAAAFCAGGAWAQGGADTAASFPSKPVHVIIPFVAGGSGDLVVRTVGQQLTQAWNQPIVVENRAGASGAIGLQAAARSAPDGYTLVLGTSSTHAINPILHHDLPYDPVKDFEPVAMLIVIPNVLVAHPSLAANNLQELIRLARSKPGELSFASNGTGTSSHMAGELLNQEAGIKLMHVPYKGAGQAMNDVLGDHVPLLFGALATSLPHVQQGRLKALGVTSKQRSAAAPDVPTFAEQGLPGFEVVQWFGLFAPKGTPREVVSKLNAQINRALESQDVKNAFTRLGFGIEPRSTEEFADYMKVETVKWKKLIKTAGIKSE